MKATVELVFSDSQSSKEAPRRITVEVREGLIGQRLLNAVDKAVYKATAQDPVLSAWVRWNLLKLD